MYNKGFFMYKETMKTWFSEDETLLHATESNTILQSITHQNWVGLSTDGAHTRNGC